MKKLTLHAAAALVIEGRYAPDLQQRIDALAATMKRDLKVRRKNASNDLSGRPAHPLKHEVLQMIAQGMATRQIREATGVSATSINAWRKEAKPA